LIAGAGRNEALNAGSRTQEISMAQCEVCGNHYDKSFEIHLDGLVHVFDSFECAIQTLAPTCAHCHCRIIGHGVEENERTFCCQHCARQAGNKEAEDGVLIGQRGESGKAEPLGN